MTKNDADNARLKIGLILPQYTLPLAEAVPRWSDIRAIAQLAEAVGFDSLWVADHLLYARASVAAQFGMPVPDELGREPPVGYWDCWSLLAAVAAVTSRVELGTIVASTSFRNPALIAKQADTLDEISGGRLILGLGAGDFKDDHDRFDFPWEPRIGRFEEAITIIHALLRCGEVDFAGEFYAARECELRPRGPRRQGPPILIGALAHAPRMLRLTAQYAEMWNAWFAFSDSTTARIGPLREAVDTACAKVGRDPATLERTIAVGVTFDGHALKNSQGGQASRPISGSPQAIAEQLYAFDSEGISHVMVWLVPSTPAGVEALAPALEILSSACARTDA